MSKEGRREKWPRPLGEGCGLDLLSSFHPLPHFLFLTPSLAQGWPSCASDLTPPHCVQGVEFVGRGTGEGLAQ